MIHWKRHGFTIVELLVVIAIISMLMALLVPAVLRSVAAARRTECLSNMRQAGMALHEQATSKGYFPGRLSHMTNEAGGNVTALNGQFGVTWVASVLPNLDQSALLDTLRRVGTIAPPDTAPFYIPVLICPSDVPPANNIPALSFVVNSGIQDFPIKGDFWDIKANGVFHDLRTRDHRARSSRQVSLDYLSKNDGATTTIMLTENVDAGLWNSLEEIDSGVVWLWNVEQKKPHSINIRTGGRGRNDFSDYNYARPSSNHTGGVNVMFCGGNARFQREDIQYWVYAQLMTPASRKVLLDPQGTFASKSSQFSWLNQLPSVGDYE